MKKNFYFIFLLVPFCWGACKSTGSQQLSKEERMQQALEKQETMYQVAASQQWVIEATTVYDRQGASYQMNPNINFVGVDSAVGTIQLAFDALVGWNGVGGITLEGSVVEHKVTKGKAGKGVSIKARFFGQGIGNADLFVDISNNGYATCQISGSFGERISFAGNFVPLALSRVYKGMPRY